MKTSRKTHDQVRQEQTSDPGAQTAVWSSLRRGPLRVAVIGSGNFGTTIAKVIGENTDESYIFDSRVTMYVHEEEVQGRKLSAIINESHENVKYLPGITLPVNVVAEPDPVAAVSSANLLVFVMPHQFVPSLVHKIKGHVRRDAKAISLIKGFEVADKEVQLFSEYLAHHLGLDDVCVLSGANVAKNIAREEFAESTIGYSNLELARVFQQLFDRPYFRINAVPDRVGVELCGALKNVVALAAGFADGLNLGSNTKAAIIRIGMDEIRRFARTFFHGVEDDTFWDSCGLADLITTCFGGRNRKCAEAYVKTRKPWDVIERELLNGQKLQGTLTASDVHAVLADKQLESRFPLFTTVYRIATNQLEPAEIVYQFMGTEPRPITVRQSKL